MYIASDPPGYTIAIYRCDTVRNLVAWKGKTELAHRHGITTKEQYETAMAELKAICERDAK
jgi:hypothetical protein